MTSNGDVPRPRASIRATVEGLESRVQALEQQGNVWPLDSTMSPLQFASAIPAPFEPDSRPDDVAAGTSLPSHEFLTPVSRGTTFPWSVLLSGTDDSNPELHNFRSTTLKNAGSESSITTRRDIISYDMLSIVPGLSPVKIENFSRNYARIAPFPILHWSSIQLSIQNLIDQKRITYSGEVTCVWIYMAFGAAHSGETTADTSAGKESGLYFQIAWGQLPQLLLEYDLWALKAITLMVHYLQATAKPQACWALLGTALRLAVSLGFDHDAAFLNIYSRIQREEGRRAFWLCYIMEKSLCISLGHASSSLSISQTPRPLPFVPEAGTHERTLDIDDHAAAIFFSQIIELTEVRDKILAAIHAGDIRQDDSYQLLLSNLEQTINARGLGRGASVDNIRHCIHDLASFNTLQVLQITRKYASGGQIPHQAILSARRSLDLISESQKSGQLMCIWMWLYYAFTSAVTLFLHSIANPIDSETALNLAAISDLENICGSVLDVSEGAARCMEIAKLMRTTIHRIIKLAERKRAREPDESDSAHAKARRVESDTTVSLNDMDREQPAEHNLLSAGIDTLLTGSPPNLVWDQWDDWLKDAASMGEDEF